MLYGTSPRDAATLAAVAGVLLVSSLAAALLPARRATLLDPAEVLRRD
jgi:ABC-type lipoprotein release transport system permease subunit